MTAFVLTCANGDILHYGVPGQQKGIRNYQNEDGSYKPGAEGRYDPEYIPTGRRRRAVQPEPMTKIHRTETPPPAPGTEYVDNKIDKSNIRQYEEEAAKRKKRAMILIGVGVAVLGAGCAYGLYKKSKQNGDTIIKAGQDIYRVAVDSEESLHDKFYATIDKGDAVKYKNIYRQQLYNNIKAGFYKGTSVEQKIMRNRSEIKVAGMDSCKKIYDELKAKDSMFGRIFSTTDYDTFNRNFMMDLQAKNAGVENEVKKFTDEIRNRGYGGFVDVNDAKYSGYNAVQPIVFLGQQSNIDVVAKKTLKENGAAYIGGLLKLNLESNAKNLAIGAAALGIYTNAKANKMTKSNEKEQQKLTPAKIARIEALSDSGMSIEKIAKRLGVSSSTVYTYLKNG